MHQMTLGHTLASVTPVFRANTVQIFSTAGAVKWAFSISEV
jgi:hypothetical protein